MTREQDLDRNERATPFKLEEARKRGQVARSTEATGFAVLSVAMLCTYTLLSPAVQGMGRLLGRGLSLDADSLNDAARITKVLGNMLHEAQLILAPLLFAVTVAAIACGVLQTGGLVFSTTPIKPDLNRLNPMQGFKRLVSMRLAYEAVKSSLKLAALAATSLFLLKSMAAAALELPGHPPNALLFRLQEASSTVTTRLCAVLLFFVVADIVYARWDFARNLRMSKREVSDEHNNREGDPRVRQRQRELRLQYLKAARAVRKVPQAQVVITNPTHVAVALRYEHGVTPAPLVLAKGAGELASRIRQAAAHAGVPIVHSPRLARALYKEVAHDSYVPERWYPSVARILVWLRSFQQARNPVITA